MNKLIIPLKPKIQYNLIRKLRIHNYAIIRDVEIDFLPHLVVITGETGAGKSIILGALNLVLGQRADSKAIGNPEEKCYVEAEFVLENDDLKSYFHENDMDYDKELVIRREIAPSGKSRAFINDSPVTLDILQTISNALIDIHQQFDTLDIYQVSTQLKMIDALAGTKPLLQDYQLTFKKYQKNLLQLTEWKEELHKKIAESEFINFQYNELEEAQLISGELSILENEQKELAHANEIKEICDSIGQTLTENDKSIVTTLKDLERRLLSIKPYHQAANGLIDRLNSTIIELEDISNECIDIKENVESNPQRLLSLDSRLDKIYKLMHKHKIDDFDALLAFKDSLQQKISSTEIIEENIALLEKEIAKNIEVLSALSDQLREKRKKVIPGFIENIYSLLHPLGMEQTKIQINLLPTTDFQLTGKDEMEFLIATNKGSSFQPIKNVASGGELARFNLVTKSLVAQAIPLPTLIFDEIDIGISGDVALKMGNILRNLAQKHQVICITHSPQIASKGEQHYFVYKDDSQERTLAQVKKLTKTERIQAIATMLSTNPPSAAAIKNAKELLEG